MSCRHPCPPRPASVLERTRPEGPPLRPSLPGFCSPVPCTIGLAEAAGLAQPQPPRRESRTVRLPRSRKRRATRPWTEPFAQRRPTEAVQPTPRDTPQATWVPATPASPCTPTTPGRRRNPVQELIEDQLTDAAFVEYIESCSRRERRTWIRELAFQFRRAKGFIVFAQEMSVSELYETAVSAVCTMVGARNAAVHLVDRENGLLYHPMKPEVRSPLEAGVVGRVAVTGEKTHVHFSKAQPPSSVDVDTLGRDVVQVLCQPLRSALGPGEEEQVVGVMSAIDCDRSSGFTPEDLAMFDAVVQQTSAGLHSASLRQSLERERAVSVSAAEMGQRLGAARGLAELLRVVAREARALSGATRSAVFVGDGAELRSAVTDSPAGDFTIAASGLAAGVLRSGESVNIPDTAADPRFHSGFDRASGFRTQTLLCIPLVQPGLDPVGVLQVMNKDTNAAFTQRDEQLLRLLGSHASAAIASASHIDRLTKEGERLRAVLRGMRGFVTAVDADGRAWHVNRDPQNVLGVAAESMKRKQVSEWFPLRHSGFGDGAEVLRRNSGMARRRSHAGSLHAEAVRSGELHLNGLLVEDVVECLRSQRPRRVTGYCFEMPGVGGAKLVDYSVQPLPSGGVLVSVEPQTEAEQIDNAIGRYLGAEEARQVSGPQTAAWQHGTVLCVDASRLFRVEAAELDPAWGVARSRELFALLGRVAAESGGRVDRFTGDAMAVTFGVPHPSHNDARRACACATRMHRDVEAWRQANLSEAPDCAVGVGVASAAGVVAVYGFGGGLSSQGVSCANGGGVKYGMVGDVVSKAEHLARTCSAMRAVALVCEQTEALTRGSVWVRDVDPDHSSRLSGQFFKPGADRLRELLTRRRDEPLSPDMGVAYAHFDEGIRYWRLGDVTQASLKFKRAAVLGSDPCAKRFAARCDEIADEAAAAELRSLRPG
eukprot:TRINITY_DN6216_c0_g1_i1.p1 TRINITY_DN6216_c0_g1~~TRINITY_DN6216_c0_g1_i1.p1  ORF type:complete len:939 (+),score=327.94 TRINITY_DN6216_c0_g1_i1:48-2864(+)